MKGELQLEPLPEQSLPVVGGGGGGGDERDRNESDSLLENHPDSPPGSSRGITHEDDIEGGSIPCCRICLECDGESDDQLISTCLCKGNQEFVHRSCLDHWCSVKEGFAFSHCTTCKAEYHLRVELFEDNSWHKIRFRPFVATRRDVFLVFLAIQMAIAAIGGFAYVMDKDGTFRNSFSDGWDHIYTVKTSYPILSLHRGVGVLDFFMLLGFLGLILHCSSLNNNDPRMASCQNCCYEMGYFGLFPCIYGGMLCLGYHFYCRIVFAILGIAYG